MSPKQASQPSAVNTINANQYQAPSSTSTSSQGILGGWAAPSLKKVLNFFQPEGNGGQTLAASDTQNQQDLNQAKAAAEAKEAKRIAELQSGFNTQKDQTFDSFNSRLGNEGLLIKGSILDFINEYKLGQQNIDKAGRDNAYAKQSGMEDIMGMVGRGIKQGGMMLQNRNASDSSAADEIAKAYAQLGQREASGVGQQYEQGQSAIEDQQNLLAMREANFNRDFEDEKTNVTNEIVDSTMRELAALDARMVEASMPERIALDQEKAKIKSKAMTQLSKYDSMLRSERAKITPTSQAEQQRQAAEMMSSGASYGGELFDYNTQAPAQFQGTGPFTSELPIFTRPRTNREG